MSIALTGSEMTESFTQMLGYSKIKTMYLNSVEFFANNGNHSVDFFVRHGSHS